MSDLTKCVSQIEQIDFILSSVRLSVQRMSDLCQTYFRGCSERFHRRILARNMEEILYIYVCFSSLSNYCFYCQTMYMYSDCRYVPEYTQRLFTRLGPWESTGLGPPDLDLDLHSPGWESRAWESTGLGPPNLDPDLHSPGWEFRGWESLGVYRPRATRFRPGSALTRLAV